MPSGLSIHAFHTVSTLRADYGGPGRSITALCSALAPYMQVELISFGQGSGEEPPVLPKDSRVNMHLLDQRGPLLNAVSSPVRFQRTIERLLADAAESARVVHDHGVWRRTNHATAVATRRAQVKRVVSPRGMLSQWALNFHRTKKRFAWMLYQARDLRTAHLIHATSEDEAEDGRRLGLRLPVAVIPNGVELPSSLPHRHRSGRMRQALFLSRIHPKKGMLELIAAWSQTRPNNWRLVVAGPDDNGHRAQAEEMVLREGLETVVEFIGSVPNEDKWRVYADSDLFILPTFSENFGIVIAEALGSGLPVITTTGAPWRVLKDQGFGWWTDIGVEPLVAAIREATSITDDERVRLGRRGHEYVAKQFSWDTVGERMATAYHWLCTGGSPPVDVRRD